MEENKNKFEKIYNTFQYAIDNEINPFDPKTWDGNYKNRMRELAGIIPLMEKEIKIIKNLIKETKF